MKISASTKLQQKLHKALGEYFEDTPLMPPKAVYSSECHEKLNAELVRDAVVLQVSYLGMDGSSGSDFDLYKLNMAYLLDPEIRATFNAVMRDQRLPTRH